MAFYSSKDHVLFVVSEKVSVCFLFILAPSFVSFLERPIVFNCGDVSETLLRELLSVAFHFIYSLTKENL